MADIPKRGFPEEEYIARTTKAQAKMAQDGLSGLLLMTEAEVRYFSGFQTLFWQSRTRPWFCLCQPLANPSQSFQKLARR